MGTVGKIVVGFVVLALLVGAAWVVKRLGLVEWAKGFFRQ
jgi:hypothetical protein